MAAAIAEFGFRVPVVATSDGQLIDGHLRLKAARQLGLAEIPVAIADDLSPTQLKAFRLAVNKMAELAEWDEDLLKIELGDLSEEGFDVGLIGFSAKEIDKMLEAAEKEALPPDDFPEFGEDIETEHQCPKCGYRWSGKAA